MWSENENKSLNIVSPIDVYDIPQDDAFVDLSSQNLTSIPEIVNSFAICKIYLQNNVIEEIPYDFFQSLPSLMWLDLRNNKISSIPESIRFHPSLSHILLQNNNLACLPNELGTLTNLKTLQLSGNPLIYPPREILDLGVRVIVKFLFAKFEEKMSSFDITTEDSENSYKKELFQNDCGPIEALTSIEKSRAKCLKTQLSVQLSDKEHYLNELNRKLYGRSEGKCPKLAKSRQVLPHYAQSRKYLKPQKAPGVDEQTAKMRRCLLKDLAEAKYKEMLAEREKVLQNRKNINLLHDWRTNYKRCQLAGSQTGSSYTFDPKSVPYETHPDHMVLLSREDLEKDLPDKYRKRLCRRSRAAPKTPGDQVLAGKIKQLFENLENINLNRESMTPRTEQKMLLEEIHKISEIRQKLTELSSVNFKHIID